MTTAHRVPINIRLESFEGPLDLLLHLIQVHEMDISRVSISKLTDQYLAYVRLMHEMNFEVASEFLLLAATLLYWKSKAILPQEGEENQAAEEDMGPTPEELLRQMLEHHRFLAAGEDLNQRNQLDIEVFKRPYKKPKIQKIWREMSLTDLALAYQETLIRASRQTKVLKKETVSVAETIREFADVLTVGKPSELRALLGLEPTVPRLVVGFLASLELAKLKKMRVHQQETYDPIYLELLENIRAIRLELATEFDVENFGNHDPATGTAAATSAIGTAAATAESLAAPADGGV